MVRWSCSGLGKASFMTDGGIINTPHQLCRVLVCRYIRSSNVRKLRRPSHTSILPGQCRVQFAGDAAVWASLLWPAVAKRIMVATEVLRTMHDTISARGEGVLAIRRAKGRIHNQIHLAFGSLIGKVLDAACSPSGAHWCLKMDHIALPRGIQIFKVKSCHVLVQLDDLATSIGVIGDNNAFGLERT